MSRSALRPKPKLKEGFTVLVNYYMEREGLNQAQLADRLRLNPSQISKIINQKCKNPSVDVLVLFCLGLRLDLKQSIELLSLAERAFSPANKAHEGYQVLIQRYHKHKDLNDDGSFLCDADEYLERHYLPALPNADI